eukprot:4118119-Prymnesium_polylepis.1
MCIRDSLHPPPRGVDLPPLPAARAQPIAPLGPCASQDLMSEAQVMAKVTGRDSTDSLTFDELLRLYVNHRPVFGISKEQIQEAFETIGVDMDGKMNRDALLRVLSQHDEGISGDDLA